MSYNIVVIPTRDRFDLLVPLVEQLLDESCVNEIFIFDNSDKQNLFDDTAFARLAAGNLNIIRVIGTPSWSVYEMWNKGMEFAKAISFGRGTTTCTILNDDLVLPGRFIETLARALLGYADHDLWCVYPEWQHFDADTPPPVGTLEVTPTHGTGKDHGLCGWAFMLDANQIGVGVPHIDTQFKWWCGDDDLVRSIAANGGKIGFVRGLGVTHYGTATGINYPELESIAWEDVERFKAKWGTW